VYTDRKTYSYNYYTHLLRTSQLVLLFQHANLSVADLQKIRQGIAKIAPPPPPASSSPSENGTEPTSISTQASFTILRTGLLSALTRHHSIPFPALKGQTALITSPTLSPKYMSQILTAINRSIKKSQREGTKGQEFKQPELKLLFGYLEGGRLVDIAQVDQVGKLPDLDGMRSQLVGLLEMRGRELVGVLGQAGGGGLVRTLQGLENGLKEKEGGPEGSA
jgi:large subunit ribosomal protein L10